MKNRKLPEALIIALVDPVKEKKLESICERLNQKELAELTKILESTSRLFNGVKRSKSEYNRTKSEFRET